MSLHHSKTGNTHFLDVEYPLDLFWGFILHKNANGSTDKVQKGPDVHIVGRYTNLRQKNVMPMTNTNNEMPIQAKINRAAGDNYTIPRVLNSHLEKKINWG